MNQAIDFRFRWYVLLGANNFSIHSNESWIEKRIEKVYRHPMFDAMKGAAYFDVAILGRFVQSKGKLANKNEIKPKMVYPAGILTKI
jgi:hypothetical protein